MEASQFLLFPGSLLNSKCRQIPVRAVRVLLRQGRTRPSPAQLEVSPLRGLWGQGASATFSGLTGFTWKLTATSLTAVVTRLLEFCPQWREPLAASQLPKNKFLQRAKACVCLSSLDFCKSTRATRLLSGDEGRRDNRIHSFALPAHDLNLSLLCELHVRPPAGQARLHMVDVLDTAQTGPES